MLNAIKITTTQEQDVSFEFHPMTSILSISIYFNDKCNNGLTKSWSVNVKGSECLGKVLKDLNAIDETKEQAIEDDFLGEAQ